MRDSLFNTCGMKMRKLLDKKSEVFAQKYGVRNVELEILLFLYHNLVFLEIECDYRLIMQKNYQKNRKIISK